MEIDEKCRAFLKSRNVNVCCVSPDLMTAKKIAEGIGERTVYKDIDVCISDLTALFSV